MSTVEDRMYEVEKTKTGEGLWTPARDATDRDLVNQREGAKLGFMVSSFWALGTGTWGKRINRYAPTFMLVMFTIAVAIGSAR
ncbi:MAG: hypothetical protein AAF367_03575 [Pseudomonadota bacterium]